MREPVDSAEVKRVQSSPIVIKPSGRSPITLAKIRWWSS